MKAFGPFTAEQLFGGREEELPPLDPATLAVDLRKARQLWNEPHVFREGDLIRSRPGINSTDSLPPLCIVMRVIPDAKERKRNLGRDDLVIGFLGKDGNFHTGASDSRRFEPVPEEDLVKVPVDFDQLRAVLSEAHGTLPAATLAPYLSEQEQLVFMVNCGWTPAHHRQRYASKPESVYVRGEGASARYLALGHDIERGFFLTEGSPLGAFGVVVEEQLDV